MTTNIRREMAMKGDIRVHLVSGTNDLGQPQLLFVVKAEDESQETTITARNITIDLTLASGQGIEVVEASIDGQRVK